MRYSPQLVLWRPSRRSRPAPKAQTLVPSCRRSKEHRVKAHFSLMAEYNSWANTRIFRGAGARASDKDFAGRSVAACATAEWITTLLSPPDA